MTKTRNPWKRLQLREHLWKTNKIWGQEGNIFKSYGLPGELVGLFFSHNI